jgi:sigma-54 dependent transcriptional regulator, flagellar regulatory protein
MNVLEKRPTTKKEDAPMVGESAAIGLVRDMIRRVASSQASVLLNGPSGSGKELAARAIHAASLRANKPFIAINCGAIPADLIESELFGHEKGSFTGANARRIGRFEEANGGTLFLDEIGDMRFDMQVKLLRVLEERVITRVGGVGVIPVDVRIVSATHQNLSDAVGAGRFREDLYFRLNVLPIRIPDLKSRCEDIPALIRHFQAEGGARKAPRFDAGGMAVLARHDWPGNVRELRNVFERAIALYPGEAIGAKEAGLLLGRVPLMTCETLRKEAVVVGTDTPHDTPQATALPSLTAAPDGLPEAGVMPIDLRAILETMELERIQCALDQADGVISEAARLLTLKRTTLIEKMRRYGVS